MIEPVDARLDEAILAEPDAVEPRRVLADFLEERAHPRAELIRLAIEDEDKARAFCMKHRELFGILDEGITTTWQLGFVRGVVVTGSYKVALENLWPTIATHRSYRFMRELAIVRGDFCFDPGLPPPDGVRALSLVFGARPVLESLARVRMPRVESLEIGHPQPRTMVHKLAVDALARVLDHALPAVSELSFVNCLDEPTVEALVDLLVRSPVRERLRRLRLDRLSEQAARSLIDAGITIALETEREAIATTTRAELRRAMRLWKQGWSDDAAGSSSPSPTRAPRGFAGMPPITQTLDQGMWQAEWAGSGVSPFDHPMGSGVPVACAGCRGTNTLVIWASSELEQSYAGWGRDSQRLIYELVCRECGRFTVHETTTY